MIVLGLVWYPIRLPSTMPAIAAGWSLLHDAMIGVLLVSALVPLTLILRKRGPWSRDLPLLYLGLCAVSVLPVVAIPTLGMAYARMQWVTLATFAAIFVCAYTVSRRAPGVVMGFAAAWLSWAVFSAIRTIAEAMAHGRLSHDSVDLMGHTNSRAGFELTMALFAIGAADSGGRKVRRVAIPLAVLLLTAIALGLSRGAWLGLLGACLLIARRRWGWGRAVLILTGCALMLALFPGPFGARARSVADAGFSTNIFRLQMWSAVFRVIGDNPWGGSGYDTLWFAMLSHLGADIPTLAGKHVHNMLLQTWAETGLLGVAALIGVFVAMMRDAEAVRRDPRPWLRPFGWGSTLLLVGVVLHGLVDCTWRDYSQQVVFWSLAGWLAATASQGRSTA